MVLSQSWLVKISILGWVERIRRLPVRMHPPAKPNNLYDPNAAPATWGRPNREDAKDAKKVFLRVLSALAVILVHFFLGEPQGASQQG
jgi:hypothetical protein